MNIKDNKLRFTKIPRIYNFVNHEKMSPDFLPNEYNSL